MAATVGELHVNLIARTNRFTKGMRAAGTRVNAFSGQIRNAAKRLALFGAGIIGIASVGAMGAMIKRNLELMDQTSKLADRLGIATEKLQGLRHAAELTGAGAQTLDAGLETMAKRLGEAARGAGAAKAALDELGLSATELVRMGIDEQFYAIAERLAKIESPAKRAAIAANIFSKANMSLERTLAQGVDGLTKMQREAERLGMTFTREMGAKAEDANDAITRLKATIGGTLIQSTADLADEIRGLADAMAAVPSAARSFRAGLLRGFASFVKPRFGALDKSDQAFYEQLLKAAERLEKGGDPEGGLRRKRAAAHKWAKEQEALRHVGLDLALDPAREARENQFGQGMEAQAREFAKAGQARTDRIRAAVRQAMAGGDGASLQLPGTARPGSQAYYAAVARHGMEETAKKTHEQLLARTIQILEVDRKNEENTSRIAQELKDLGVIDNFRP